MENGEKNNRISDRKSDVVQLNKELEAARQNADIYQTARILQMLTLRGVAIPATEHELAQISENLERARRDEPHRALAPLHRGYEIARWLMLKKVLDPESLRVTSGDEAAIREAINAYKDEENFYQIASLLRTCDSIGVTISLNSFSDQERRAIQTHLQAVR